MADVCQQDRSCRQNLPPIERAATLPVVPQFSAIGRQSGFPTGWPQTGISPLLGLPALPRLLSTSLRHSTVGRQARSSAAHERAAKEHHALRGVQRICTTPTTSVNLLLLRHGPLLCGATLRATEPHSPEICTADSDVWYQILHTLAVSVDPSELARRSRVGILVPVSLELLLKRRSSLWI